MENINQKFKKAKEFFENLDEFSSEERPYLKQNFDWIEDILKFYCKCIKRKKYAKLNSEILNIESDIFLTSDACLDFLEDLKTAYDEKEITDENLNFMIEEMQKSKEDNLKIE